MLFSPWIMISFFAEMNEIILNWFSGLEYERTAAWIVSTRLQCCRNAESQPSRNWFIRICNFSHIFRFDLLFWSNLFEKGIWRVVHKPAYIIVRLEIISRSFRGNLYSLKCVWIGTNHWLRYILMYCWLWYLVSHSRFARVMSVQLQLLVHVVIGFVFLLTSNHIPFPSHGWAELMTCAWFRIAHAYGPLYICTDSFLTNSVIDRSPHGSDFCLVFECLCISMAKIHLGSDIIYYWGQRPLDVLRQFSPGNQDWFIYVGWKMQSTWPPRGLHQKPFEVDKILFIISFITSTTFILFLLLLRSSGSNSILGSFVINFVRFSSCGRRLTCSISVRPKPIGQFVFQCAESGRYRWNDFCWRRNLTGASPVRLKVKHDLL